jgi:hypothetical protein
VSRAGSREKRYKHVGFGRLAKNKIAILRTQTTQQLSLLINFNNDDPELELENETGESLILVIPVPGRRQPLSWNMTGMTEAELEATRQFFNHLFDQAEPIVRLRDKVANDAFAEGDDSYSRVYRTLPQFIVRPRPELPDSEGIRLGPESPPGRDGGNLYSGDGVRGSGDELADGEPEPSRGQDYGETPH